MRTFTAGICRLREPQGRDVPEISFGGNSRAFFRGSLILFHADGDAVRWSNLVSGCADLWYRQFYILASSKAVRKLKCFKWFKIFTGKYKIYSNHKVKLSDDMNKYNNLTLIYLLNLLYWLHGNLGGFVILSNQTHQYSSRAIIRK